MISARYDSADGYPNPEDDRWRQLWVDELDEDLYQVPARFRNLDNEAFEKIPVSEDGW